MTTKRTGRPPKPAARRTQPGSPTRLAVLTAICADIADGDLIEHAARAHGISPRGLREWLRDDDALVPLYTRARDAAADALAERAVKIALATTKTTWQANRLKVDTLKWLASKRRPREYGEKVDVTSGGEVVRGVIAVPVERPDDA